MEIIIGSIPPLALQNGKQMSREKGTVEAKLLNIREPRRGIAGPSGAERRGKQSSDPVNGKVLTLMVMDAGDLPKDIGKSEYRILLRFQRK